MTRPCFALTLLFGSLATTLLAVSTARCQIIVTFWDAGVSPRSESHAGAMPPRDEDFYENYRDTADHYDDYLYEDYATIDDEDDFIKEDYLDQLLFGKGGREALQVGGETSGELIADEVAKETAVDPEAEYASDYAYEDYDCFGYACGEDYFYDEDYGFPYSCPLAEGTKRWSVESHADYYDYHAEHDPVYDAVMFGNGLQEAVARSTSANDSPQSWDSYDYDSGYDYENEYYDWYATGDYTPKKTSKRAEDDQSNEEASSPYEELYRYDEAEFEEAYNDYWYGPSKSGESKSAANQYFDGETLRKRVADVFSTEVREAAASSGAACVDLGVNARNGILLFAAETLDRLSGTLQDASAGLTRIAGHDRATETH